MSQWGTLDATFVIADSGMLNAAVIRQEITERAIHAPTGSEDGPGVYEPGENTVYVEGRLRDVSDAEDSPMVLAWFMSHVFWCSEATLLWELDSGPRYRYEWKDRTLTKLKGVLDL